MLGEIRENHADGVSELSKRIDLKASQFELDEKLKSQIKVCQASFAPLNIQQQLIDDI